VLRERRAREGRGGKGSKDSSQASQRRVESGDGDEVSKSQEVRLSE
jgi:hypothetical protein